MEPTKSKKYSLYIFLILLFLFSWNYKLISYGLSQLDGQINILYNAKEITDVIKDQNFPDSLKRKLLLIQEIKAFAIDSIGLSPSNSYETVFNQEGKPILKIITACKPFELEDYTWSFPILGEVSYKGFFNNDRLQEELKSITKKGYDTNISEVTAWSTLGWFKDPVLTNFINKSDGKLANLIIHELTHGTMYVKSDVYFNENLASFIGHIGAQQFLIHKFGIDSPEHTNYLQEMSDEELLSDFVVNKSKTLDSLYQSFDRQMALNAKITLKRTFIDNFHLQLQKLPINSIKKYTPKKNKINNTYFQSFRRYHLNMDEFEDDYKSFSNLSEYINYIKKKYD